MEQMEKQAEHVGTRLVADQVIRLDLSQRRSARMRLGRCLFADSVVLATARRRAGSIFLRAEVQGLRSFRCALRRFFYREGSAGDWRRQHRVEEALFLTTSLRMSPWCTGATIPAEKSAGPPVQESRYR